MAELLINGNDALTTYGVRMGDGFLDALGTPAQLKDYITNDSRLENGISYCKTVPKQSARDVTLQFVMIGETAAELSAFRTAFYAILYAGDVTVQVSDNTADVYKLKYKSSSTYAQNTKRNICKMSVKFTEPNPTDRT